MKYINKISMNDKVNEIYNEIINTKLFDINFPIKDSLGLIFEITPEIYENEFIPLGAKELSKIILHDEFGILGAHTIKPGNFKINFKKAIEQVFETGMSTVESTDNPFLLLLAALIGLRKLLCLQKIELDINHAMVIAFLWRVAEDKLIQISNERLLFEINNHFEKFEKARLNNVEFNRVLGNLDTLKSIKLLSDGTIELVEQVILVY